MTRHLLAAACAAVLAAACGTGNDQPETMPVATTAADGRPFAVEQVTRFDEPWAMTFLPDGRLLVTEKPGQLPRPACAGVAGR